MKVHTKHFYTSIYFLNELLSNKRINAVTLSDMCETCLRNARKSIREIKDMLLDLNLNLIFWYDRNTNSNVYYLKPPTNHSLLQNLSYKNLDKYLPYIVMIKLLFNQKVNNEELSQDGFKCSKKMLYPIIDALRMSIAMIPTRGRYYDIVYSELYKSYIIKEIR